MFDFRLRSGQTDVKVHIFQAFQHLSVVEEGVSGGKCPIYEEKTQKDGTYQRNKKEKTRTNWVLVINSTYTVKRQANLQTFHMQVAPGFQTASKCGVREIFHSNRARGLSGKWQSKSYVPRVTATDTHTQTYIYVYACVRACVCMHV